MASRINLVFSVAFLAFAPVCYMVTGSCYDTAIGLQHSSTVYDARFSASSQYDVTTPASNGRLEYTSGSSWCALSRDSTPYLQVDLGSVYIICGVATQGNSQADQWVRTYQVQYSTNGSSWKDFQENGLVKTFQGNYDRSTVVKRFLYDGVQAQYIRALPKLHYNRACLRLELYGVTKKACSKSTVGIADRAKVPDHRFSASSSFKDYFRPYYARDNKQANGWAPAKDGIKNSWLKIDLGNAFVVCGIATRGRPLHSMWVMKYKVRLSMDSVTWQYYQENGTDKVFIGNKNSFGLVKNNLNQGFPAKLIEVWPIHWKNYPVLRVELYGVTQGCRSSLGIETSGGVLNSQLTASSGTASDGRLYKPSTAWCSDTRSNTEYLQVDLKRLVTLTGVSTQGHLTRQEWIKTFIIKYSFDNSEWFEFKDGESSVKTFNSTDGKLRTSWFKYPFVARYVRIHPQTWQQTPCLRFDLYGCDNVNSPKVSVQGAIAISGSGTNAKVTIVVECRAHGQPSPDIKWTNGATDVTSQARLLTQSNGFTYSNLTFQFPVSQLTYKFSCQNRSSRLLKCSWQSYKCGASYPEVHGGARSFAQTSLSIYLAQVTKQQWQSTESNTATLIIAVVLAVLVFLLTATTVYLLIWRMERKNKQRGATSLQPTADDNDNAPPDYLELLELNITTLQQEQNVNYESLQHNQCSTEEPETDDSSYENDIDERRATSLQHTADDNDDAPPDYLELLELNNTTLQHEQNVNYEGPQENLSTNRTPVILSISSTDGNGDYEIMNTN